MTKTLAILAALCLPTPALQAATPNAETRSPTQAAVRNISDERVEFAIDAAVEFLFSQQGNSGRWRTEDIATAYPRAQTALAAFALTVAGASPNDPRMQKAIRKLDDRERVTSVWARAMTLRLFCRLDPRRYKRAIEDDVHFLLVQQDKSGNWGEGVLRKGGRGKVWRDHANSALALRALADAEAVGAEVRATAWRRAEDAWIARQNPDGGWGYSASDDPRFADESQESTVEMTAAGLASLRLVYQQLYLTAERPFNGRFKGLCGQEVAKTKPIRTAVERATNWLDEHALITEPIATAHGPRGDVGAEWATYTLAQIAQFAAQAGLLRIGEQAWFPAIARRLIDTQHEDGSWGTIEQTCYALLALLHGRTPIVVGKLAYGGREDWNNDPHDAAGLMRFFQSRTGRAAGWQIVSLDRIADEVFRAPVLYLTGHGPPQLTEENRETLREFVWSGGTIMAAACCSKKEFTEGSAALFEEMFPRLVRSVPPDDHPIWSTPDPIQPKDDVIGFSD
ncbi:MAG: DUF4159 domain-containing protein, partial [Planctomycetes bacterium]|nr:DUF4159 domain-containing protein [Planctomycetota bacterium]